MPLLKTIKYIINHPINKNHWPTTIYRFLKWQLICRTKTTDIVWPFVEESKFFVSKGKHSLTCNIYCGINDYEEMGLLLHFLRPEDLFIDAGANLGSYSILAAAVKKAKVLCFEPVTESYQHLVKNISLNEIQHLVQAHNIGLGEGKSLKRISINQGAANQITDSIINSTEIQIDSLDRFTIGQMPNFIKIDVQGYEWPILMGMTKTLKANSLKVIVIEMDGSGKQFGYSEKIIHELILSFGFIPYRYNPKSRVFTELSDFIFPNTIYLRDLSFIKQRVKSAKPFEVFGQKF